MVSETIGFFKLEARTMAHFSTSCQEKRVAVNPVSSIGLKLVAVFR